MTGGRDAVREKTPVDIDTAMSLRVPKREPILFGEV